MDYANRRRVKIWGRARVTRDAEMVARLMPEHYRARPEQAILFAVDAWDTNCPQLIPQKFGATDVQAALDRLNAEIAELKRENDELRHRLERTD